MVRSIHLKPTVNIDCRVAESSHQTVRLGVENIELVRAVVELLLQGVQEEGEVRGGAALSIEINVVASVVPTEQGIFSCTTQGRSLREHPVITRLVAQESLL